MFRNQKRWFCSFIFTVLILLMAIPASAATTKVELIKNSSKAVSTQVGASFQLTLPGASGKVKWKSSKSSVATVTQKGVVKAKKKGSATITATVGKDTYKCVFNVSAAPKKVTKVKLAKSKLSLYTMAIYKQTVTVSPTNAANTKVRWSTSDSTIARVDSYGNIYALTPGTAIIKATAADGSGKSASCTVTVTADPMQVTTTKTSIAVGATQAIKVLNLKKTDTVVWGTSNKGIVTVENGIIKGIKEGTAVVAAKRADSADGKTKSNKTVYCVVTVTKPLADYNAKGASPKAKKFLQLLRTYAERVESDYQKGIYWRYQNMTPESTFAEAIAKNNRIINCAMLANWGLRDLGVLITGKSFYGIEGGTYVFKGTGKEEIMRHCEMIYGYKTAAELVKEGKLLPGDIVSMRDVGHTRVYAGDNRWFDTGRSICYNSKKGVFNTFGPTKGSMNGVVGYIIRLK